MDHLEKSPTRMDGVVKLNRDFEKFSLNDRTNKAVGNLFRVVLRFIITYLMGIDEGTCRNYKFKYGL